MHVVVTETIWREDTNIPDEGYNVFIKFAKFSNSNTVTFEVEGRSYKISSEELREIALQLSKRS